MSSISSISSGLSPTQPASSGGIKQSLNALQSALQSGNLSAAQTAFSNLVNNFPQLTSSLASGTSSPGSSGSTNPVQNDLKSVQTALQSGNISVAQTAFAKLQTDLQGTKDVHGGHRPHGGGGGPSALESSTAQPSTSTSSSSSSDNSSTTSGLSTNLLNAIQTAGGSTGSNSVDQLA